jgi:death-on-curing protein
LILPVREDIVLLNRRHIEQSGGMYVEPDNLIKPGSLEWVLEAIQYPLFSTDPYPTLCEKAAILAWTIIDDHVFYDGCKRTGMSALEIFIEENGFRLNATNEEILGVALRIAGGYPEEEYSFEQFAQWVRSMVVSETTGG